MKRRLMLGLFLLAGLGVLGLAAMSFFSRKPTNLGIVDGRLADCPATPNCVCTFATDAEHAIEPLHFAGSPAEALTRLKSILAAMLRASIVTADERYLHVEFTTLIFRFVDDVEFLIDADAKRIHFRSASRVGRSDLGVNRQRMEAIRAQFERK
ncbi:MAG: DUF1499 domain-containing protein [Gemmataceae bacterium]|nr:DUF1499 domain-containing protein [Gemmataceae bacterium]